MKEQTVQNVKNGLKGTITIPGDKSISHRAVMFGAIAQGKTTIKGFLPGADCLSTIACFKEMGVEISQNGDEVVVNGKGLEGLQEPKNVLDVGNSGTTIRLISGILANTSFHSCIQGDSSIGKRPMKRVTNPLRLMGAKIDGREEGTFTPLTIRGGGLKAIEYVSPVASAQVKSAILLAGLTAEGVTSVTEPHISRDHTERMLEAFGVTVTREGKTVKIAGGQQLIGTDIQVPGDVSSAAFFLVAGAVIPNSKLVLQNVGMNPTRTGIIDVLKKMGAKLEIHSIHKDASEPAANITIETSSLQGIEISGEIIPRLIDEIPIIALAATQAEGITVIKDAHELKVKETNRIDTVVAELTKLGARIEATDDGMVIYGKSALKGGTVNSHGDHRIGMMLAIAGCIADNKTVLEDAETVGVSYPTFFQELSKLQTELEKA
ncbi:3-phosphoshikimate 1-carboxyvinyltransferase [Bacillus pseudomycoides]|uniref:3-phosphoshikimate 1-carboxyvinyltransferase n=1 Tax=Bacillus pseudomycoides TaxID=64104 RepID=A0AA91VA48_9BACI|nr:MULTISPECIES: 3-phosphoshikimate 1-carboxyvinyltransferase [Bacillus]PEB56199.1 3-phosphoshikimate 1-carboxyvinyltransferase [Bacillus sp. AFS098217]PED81405.1 3-phosphoshikimate 1-carboxyvinyltransferase [Bacillus pseudomycoides]PEU11322.1 3-phosphoshikimate 1-carboxyvinyltransferase [Bacillus sp. AFS019443]PEU18342.1 3-phosphoshikimate 1-carboxyvinyltransferase [Bacillus sp. AFS014408]PFW60029.1 3-phosphoshikimate 1-carboxyvinyltransferase [Bacillus sp. AFS075034]